jgi:molybdate transport system substrate-binding protein
MAMLARGETDLGVTFVTEIGVGVQMAGILPREISTPTSLTGFVSSRAKSALAAKALLRYLSSPEAATVYRSVGMQPTP